MDTLYIHALSPVHAGTGQASAGIVDLPVAREKATNWPMIPASSIKGVCRDEVKDEVLRARLFGIEDRRDESGTAIRGNAGALQFGDARLLCFPVRSWMGVFAYVTCPLALKRLLRDSHALGSPAAFTVAIPAVSSDETALVTTDSVLYEKPTEPTSATSRFWIQDLELVADACAQSVDVIAKGIALAAFPEEDRAEFVSRFIIVSNDVFNFLTETATEVTAHIKLQDDTKTVQKGGLWYVESVPAEALFTAFIGGEDFPLKNGIVLQLGGDENTGRGLCRIQRGGA